MGTRADFYKGVIDPKWIGSIFKDGVPWNIPCKILVQINEIMFEETVIAFLKISDGIIESQGDSWPWPWEDSYFTDYSYFFSKEDEKVYAYSMAEKLIFSPIKIIQGYDLLSASCPIEINFPRMGIVYGSDATKIRLGSKI